MHLLDEPLGKQSYPSAQQSTSGVHNAFLALHGAWVGGEVGGGVRGGVGGAVGYVQEGVEDAVTLQKHLALEGAEENDGTKEGLLLGTLEGTFDVLGLWLGSMTYVSSLMQILSLPFWHLKPTQQSTSFLQVLSAQSERRNLLWLHPHWLSMEQPMPSLAPAFLHAPSLICRKIAEKAPTLPSASAPTT